MSWHHKLPTKCAKLVDEKKIVISSQTYWSKVYILQMLKKSFLMKKGTKFTKQKHVLLFILYSIWVHVESPKYKMICLNSPKSSEFAIF